MTSLYKLAAIALPLLLSIAAFTSSCGRSGNESTSKTSFKEELHLAADSAEIGVIIKSGKIFSADPYILVSDTEHTDGMHFAVFDQQLKYLYSFCPYGAGPSECQMPVVVLNRTAKNFLIKDFADDTYHEYQLSDSSATETGTFKIKDFSRYESLWDVNHLADNKYLAKGVAPKLALRRLIDFGSETTLDSLQPSFDLFESMGSDYYTEYDDFSMVAAGSHFACAYFLINRIEFGRISNDSLSIVKYIGTDTPPAFHPYTSEVLDGKYKYNVDYNTVYYENLFGTDTKVYATYFGQPWGDIKQHSHILEIYSYEGDPEINCTLDIPIASFIVLDNNRIIAINPERSDDSFYIFDIGETRRKIEHNGRR